MCRGEFQVELIEENSKGDDPVFMPIFVQKLRAAVKYRLHSQEKLRIVFTDKGARPLRGADVRGPHH